MRLKIKNDFLYTISILEKMDKMEVLNTVKQDIEENEPVHNDSDDEVSEENIVIRNFSIGGDKRVDVSSMLSTILAQRELDQKRFLLLSKKNGDLEIENSKLETKLHYMKLDLVNSEIKVQSSMKKIEIVSKNLHEARESIAVQKRNAFICHVFSFFFGLILFLLGLIY